MPDVTGTAVTPGKRVMPLLANFEEWMKMATDNVWNHSEVGYMVANTVRKSMRTTPGTLR
jgi:condensin complex subunit 2